MKMRAIVHIENPMADGEEVSDLNAPQEESSQDFSAHQFQVGDGVNENTL